MQMVAKRVIKTGNSATIVLDKKITFASDIDVGDMVAITCDKHQITITKIPETKNDTE